MQPTNKKKTLTLITITGITLILGVIAVVTALRLRSLGTQPIAPNVPQSQPKAQEVPPSTACIDQFSVLSSSCNEWCNSDSDCSDTGFCYITDESTSGVCRNAACDTETDCVCPTPQYLECDTENYTCNLVDGVADNECSADSNGAVAPECVPPSYTACDAETQTCIVMDGVGEDSCIVGLNPDDCTLPTHTECINEACVEVTGEGTSDCTLGNDVTCEEPEHLECVEEACLPVAGGGDNTCSDSTECVTAQHTICENEACVQVDGAGDNECDFGDDTTCAEPEHLACVNLACVPVQGAGSDTCESDTDCYYYSCTDENTCGRVEGNQDDSCAVAADCQEERHNVCQNEACVTVDGAGDNTCVSDSDCETPTHRACVNNSCSTVTGGGIDTCETMADCAPASGPTSTPRPTTRPTTVATTAPNSTPLPTAVPTALPQAGTTAPTIAIITMGAIFLLAGLAAVFAL